MPWFPGHAKLLDDVSRALLAVLFAVARDLLNRFEEVRMPAEIRYRAGWRERVVSPGAMATSVLAVPR